MFSYIVLLAFNIFFRLKNSISKKNNDPIIPNSEA